jgi:amidase
MNRRDFIKNGSRASASLLIPSFILQTSLQACQTQRTASGSPDTFVDSFQWNEITIDALQQQMQSGKLTARAMTDLYLKRIQAIDKSGPTLNAIIEINPDALAIAEALDEERRNGKVRGPLHGIPVLIKDNIDTADKMMTTAGSLALEGNVASQDAFIVKQLREAGVVLLGKTNLSEWANFRSTRSSSGWSSRGGQTKNPYSLVRNPCGSSSGSGVAVAANLCMVAIGTETNGSVICPSSINGVVGIKPTVGLVSRSGIIPISHSQDTAGPMARTVRDAAIMLGALIGADPRDAATQQAEDKVYQDYTQFLDHNGLQGKRIGVEKSYLKGHEAIDVLMVKAMEQLKAGGATVIEVDFRERTRGIGGAGYTVLQYEFKDGLNKYLANAKGKVKSLKELIEFNKANEARLMPYFKQEILEASEEKGSLESVEYKEALEKVQTTTRNAINSIMDEHKLDVLCGPSNGPSWCIDLVNGDNFTGYGMYSPAAQAGYPSINVPLGFVFDLPVGLTFLGRAFSEPELLAVAYAYEQLSKNRKAPAFIEANANLARAVSLYP